MVLKKKKRKEKKRKKQKSAQANHRTTQFASRNWINQAPVSFYIVSNNRGLFCKRFLIILFKFYKNTCE